MISNQDKKIKAYRPDIDGLRAIAVLLVLFFHAGFTFLPGGFVGVDVFFVISGFLITSIIYREVNEGTYSFVNFYKRRIRRLMPALFTMLFATSIAAYFILLPNAMISYAKSLFFAMISVSNIFFWRENGGYFGDRADEAPLLHTWSFSVEEQYYLFWSIYIIILYRYLPRQLFVGATILFFFFSLGLSEWVARVTFGASYYLLPTRMFELIGGSLLAITWKTLPSSSRLLNDLFSICGLALIMLSAFLLHGSDRFPGFNAVYVTIGTMLLIYSGRSELGIVNKALSLRPVVFIGLISYSLYLWHWPIIVFLRQASVVITTQVSILIVISSILMGWISWQFVEQRYRYAKGVRFRHTFATLYLLPFLFIASVSAASILNEGFPSRFDNKINVMEQAIYSKPDVARGECHSPSRNSNSEPLATCLFGDPSRTHANAFMIGDSHANHFTGFIDEIAKSSTTVQDYTLDACLPAFDLFYGRNMHYASSCKGRNDLARKFISDNHFDYVILSGEWPTIKSYRNFFVDGVAVNTEAEMEQLLQKSLLETVAFITKTGARAVFIKDNPSTSHLGPTCPLVRALSSQNLVCSISYNSYIEERKLMDRLIDNIIRQYPSTIVIDPAKVMCDERQCFSELDGIPLYRDDNHLNEMGSRLLGKKYLAAIGNPFVN